MFNVNLIGNLGRDAKTVTAGNGKSMTSLALACNDARSDKPIWVDVLMHERPNLSQYLVKGTKLFVQGDCSLKFENGYFHVNVFATCVQLIDSKQETMPTETPDA